MGYGKQQRRRSKWYV